MVADDCEPQLGCATTRQLLEELSARIEVSKTIGEEIDLDYRTVDS
jgi:hypothetical protein